VKLSLDPALSPVKGNSGKLQQVFLNLFLNARDAMESGGALTVKTWSEDGVVRVEVTDNGPGIAPEHLSRIYDPFFHHQGRAEGNRFGAFGKLWHCARTRR